MKTSITACLIICMMVLIITACRADDRIDDFEDSYPIYSEHETTEDAYPALESSYPIGEAIIPVEEAAYPITEADLAWLLQTWRLTGYVEDGVDQDPPDKKITFNSDGSYIITRDSEQEVGTWSTILLAVESTLILTKETGDMQYYQILQLAEAELNLSTQLGNRVIDKVYLPAD